MCNTTHLQTTASTSQAHLHYPWRTTYKCVKYLGVHISNNLLGNHHTSLTAKKANSTIGFLRRNIGSCPDNMKKPTPRLYGQRWSMKLRYGPHTTANVVKLEVDYQQTSSPAEMLRQLQIPSLEQRRLNMHAITMFKLLHQEIALPVTPLTHNTRRTRGHGNVT